MEDIILYGAGIRGLKYLGQLNELGYTVSYFVDRDSNKIGKIIQNVRVIGITQLKEMSNYQLWITPLNHEEIAGELLEEGIPVSNNVSLFELTAKKWIDSDFTQKIIDERKDSNQKTIFFDCENGICLGGVESWCLDIGKGLSEDGFRVRYIAKKLPVELPIELENQMDYVRIQSSHMFEELAMEDMITVIANNVPCTVVTCMPDEVMVAACAVKAIVGDKVHIVSAIHNDLQDFYEKNLSLDKYIDEYICVSKKIQHEMKKRVANPEKVLRKVSPIVHKEVISRTYSKPNEKLRLGLAGRLVIQQKRLDLLVPLMVKLKILGIGYILELAGDGDYLTEIKKDIKRFNLEDNIIIHGRIDNEKMYEFWSRQDICINLSDFEGRSLTIMEAMSAGAIPVVTNTSGNEDIIQGVNGFVVELEDIDTMSEIIMKLSKQKNEFQKIGIKAHEVIVRECNREEYMLFIKGII